MKFDINGLCLASDGLDWEMINFEYFNNFDSPNTRRCYHRDIQLFFKFCENFISKAVSPLSLERAHVVAFKNYLMGLEQAPKTICRKLSSLSSYFDFLLEKNIIKNNPCKGVRRPKQLVKNETMDLSDDAVNKLFESLFQNRESITKSIYLHRAVIFLLFSTGLRKGELSNLKVKDYKKIDEGTYCLIVRAKGGKYLTKVLHPSARIVLDEYINFQITKGAILNPDEFLLKPTRNPLEPGKLNKPLNPKTVDYILRKYCLMAGIEKRITPHSARATYIGSALENGVELWRVSQDVGHESVRTTEIYNKRRSKINNSPVHSLGFLNGCKKAS